MGVMRASVVALALGTYSRDHERWAVKAVADSVRVRLSKWASIEVESFERCVGRGRGPLGSKAAARDATCRRAVVARFKRLASHWRTFTRHRTPPEDTRLRRHAVVARPPSLIPHKAITF